MIPGVNDRAQCSAPLPPPPLWVVETTKTWTGWPAACRPPAVGPLWRRRCTGCRRRCRHRGEAAGGGREARGIPGRGEENEYRGRKVQGGGGGGRGSARAGGRGGRQRRRLGRRSRGRGTSSGVVGDGDGRGLDDRTADAPPLCFRGGSLLPPLVNIPVDGDGLTVRGD